MCQLCATTTRKYDSTCRRAHLDVYDMPVLLCCTGQQNVTHRVEFITVGRSVACVAGLSLL